METSIGPGGHLRISELSRRSGVSPGLLRAWERRYGLLTPARSGGGYRLYDERSVEVVERMRAHIHAGVSAAEAAQLTRAEFAAQELEPARAEAPPAESGRRASGPGRRGPALGVSAPAGAAEPAAALGAALDRLDETGAHAAFDRLLATFGKVTVLEEAVLPYLRELGRRWEAGEAVIAQEHFASALLRGRLLGLARGWGGGAGPLALLACAPGDQHDLGLICFGLAVREHGWRVAFFGADTPLAVLIETTRALTPARVVLSLSDVTLVEGLLDELVEIAHEAPLALAGGGSGPEIAARVGAIHLSEGPLAAAAYVAGAGKH